MACLLKMYISMQEFERKPVLLLGKQAVCSYHSTTVKGFSSASGMTKNEPQKMDSMN